jgi:transposase InsO family protein
MIVAWDIRSTMRDIDSEIVLQKARETSPEARPRIITDQGSPFKRREFKSFLAQWQANHVMTSPYYAQSNGKIERFHQALKDHAIRPLTPLDLDDAKRITGDFIEYYNTTRLHSAIGFIAPKDRLEGRRRAIHKAREKKLDEARKRRKIVRQKLTLNTSRN